MGENVSMRSSGLSPFLIGFFPLPVWPKQISTLQHRILSCESVEKQLPFRDPPYWQVILCVSIDTVILRVVGVTWGNQTKEPFGSLRVLGDEDCSNRPFVLSLGTVVIQLALGSTWPHDRTHPEGRRDHAVDPCNITQGFAKRTCAAISYQRSCKGPCNGSFGAPLAPFKGLVPGLDSSNLPF